MSIEETTDGFIDLLQSDHELINEQISQSLSEENLQVLYQVVASLCSETLILISIGPSSSGKTITLNRLTAGLVQLDLNKYQNKRDPLFSSEAPDLFDHRQPVCYVRELDFTSQNCQNSQECFNKTIRLAVIDTPGITNKIQLSEDIIKRGLKSLDSFVQACIHELNDHKAHIVVIYFMKQPWCWSKVDRKLVTAIHAVYKINMFCITHALVEPDFLPSPQANEISALKKLNLPDTVALLEEEESYLQLVSAEEYEEAKEEFYKKWEILYKRLTNLSDHITQIRECVTDAKILLFENSPNYSTWSDIGLANLVFKFSRQLSYNYGCLFTILTTYSLLHTFSHSMFLPTSMDRSRISRMTKEQDKRELSTFSFFQKHDTEEYFKGQLDFYKECKEVVDEISLDVIFRISNAYFSPENKSKTIIEPLALGEDEKKSKFFPKLSQESLRSCGSTISDSDVSSSASTSGSSDYQKKTKPRLLSLKSIWADIFESKETGFSFLFAEVQKYPEDAHPINRYKCKKRTLNSPTNSRASSNKQNDDKDFHKIVKDYQRRHTQPTLNLTNNLTCYLSPKKSSLPADKIAPILQERTYNTLHSSDKSTPNRTCFSDSFNSDSNSIRKSGASNSTTHVPLQENKSNSSDSKTLGSSHRSHTRNKSKSETSELTRGGNFSYSKSISYEDAPDSLQCQAFSNELETTLVNLLGAERDNCMLCKEKVRDLYCPKCNRGYCEICVATIPTLRRCSFDRNMLVRVDK